MMGGHLERNPSVRFCYSTFDKGGRGGRRSDLSLCIARKLYWEPLLISAIKENFLQEELIY